ncbi:MAG: hypothetical protein IIA87_05605 [Nanoarchaeota archaeon]|nr:hypothetical protein [Nanoarchaeota archaeon]
MVAFNSSKTTRETTSSELLKKLGNYLERFAQNPDPKKYILLHSVCGIVGEKKMTFMQ